MDLQQSTIMANKFQSVLDADVLNECGKQLGFAKRERLITPFSLGSLGGGLHGHPAGPNHFRFAFPVQ